MPKNVASIPRDKADKLLRVTISFEGIKTRDGAEKALRGLMKIPDGISLEAIEGREQDGNYLMYPRICCWKTGGRWVWGVEYFGYCEYRGEGCPA